MTAFRLVVEGVGDEPVVIEDCDDARLPFEGEEITLGNDADDDRVDGVFVVDRVGHGPKGPTVFVRPA